MTCGKIADSLKFSPPIKLTDTIKVNNFPAISWREPITYRLMHAFFHIRTVIIPRDRYQKENFSPRVDNGRGMITVLIWKRACINQFITYFNIELK